MRYLILWETNVNQLPDIEEQKNGLISALEDTKEAVDSGKVKMWGISLDAGHGFAVVEREARLTDPPVGILG